MQLIVRTLLLILLHHFCDQIYAELTQQKQMLKRRFWPEIFFCWHIYGDLVAICIHGKIKMELVIVSHT